MRVPQLMIFIEPRPRVCEKNRTVGRPRYLCMLNMHGRAFFAVVAMAMATVAVSQDLDFFAKHVNPLTEVVQKKWGNATAKWSVSARHGVHAH